MFTPEQAAQVQQIQQPNTPTAPDPLAAQADALSKQIADMLVQHPPHVAQTIMNGLHSMAVAGTSPQNPGQAVQTDLNRQQDAQQAAVAQRVSLLNQIRQQQVNQRQLQQGQQELDIRKSAEQRASDLAPLEKQNVQAQIDERARQANAPTIRDIPRGGKMVIIDKDGKVMQEVQGNPEPVTESSKQSKEMMVDGKRMQVTFDPKSGKYSDPQGADVTTKVQGEYHQPPQEPTNTVEYDDPVTGKRSIGVLDRKNNTIQPATVGGQAATKVTAAENKANTADAELTKSYNALQALAKLDTSAANQAMVTQYFDIIKPGSGARMNEAEIRRLTQLGSLPKRAEMWFTRAQSGQIFDDGLKKEILDASKAIVDAKSKQPTATTGGVQKLIRDAKTGKLVPAP